MWRVIRLCVTLCVKARYFRRLLPMEERNCLLKCFQFWDPPSFTLRELARHPEIWSSPISDVQQEGSSSSSYVIAGRATVRPGSA